MSRLEGATALITGASGGIGAAVATGLCGRGARVLLTGRDPKRLEASRSEAAAAGGEALARAADLSSPQGCQDLVAETLERFGGLDLLIHSAGLFVGGRIADAPADDLERLMAINVVAPYRLTQLCLPTLVERRGQVVLINSTAGRRAVAGMGAYCASKHALTAFGEALRHEVNDAGVRVLSVFPGRTASAMQAEVRRFEGLPYDPGAYMGPDDVAAPILTALELPDSAEVTDFAIRPMRKGP